MPKGKSYGRMLNLESQNESLQNKLKQANVQIKTLQNTNAGLSHQLDEANDKLALTPALEQRVTDTENKITQLQHDYDKQAETNSHLYSENSELTKQNQALKDQAFLANKAAKEERLTLITTSQALQTSLAENKSQTSTIENQQLEINKLREQVVAAKTTTKVMTDALTNKEAECDEQLATLKRLYNENHALQASELALKKQLAKVTSELEKQAEMFKAANTATEQAFANHRVEMLLLQTQVTMESLKNTKLQSTIECLQVELKNAHSQIQSLQQELTTRKNDALEGADTDFCFISLDNSSPSPQSVTDTSEEITITDDGGCSFSISATDQSNRETPERPISPSNVQILTQTNGPGFRGIHTQSEETLPRVKINSSITIVYENEDNNESKNKLNA